MEEGHENFSIRMVSFLLNMTKDNPDSGRKCLFSG